MPRRMTLPSNTSQNAVPHSAHTHHQRAPHTTFRTLPTRSTHEFHTLAIRASVATKDSSRPSVPPWPRAVPLRASVAKKDSPPALRASVAKEECSPTLCASVARNDSPPALRAFVAKEERPPTLCGSVAKERVSLLPSVPPWP